MTSPFSRRPATLPYALRLALGGAFIALATLTAEAEETRPIPQSPDILLGPLFNDVQSAKLLSLIHIYLPSPQALCSLSQDPGATLSGSGLYYSEC